MTASVWLCLLGLVGAASSAAPAGQPAALQRVQTIALPSVRGRLDHLAIDAEGRRLFVAAADNNTVEVIDLLAGTILHTMHGLKEPQGVVYIPEAKTLAVSSGGDGSVKFYDDSYRMITSLALGSDADNMRYDAARNLLYVGYGSGGIAIIDPIHGRITGHITLPAHPESFQLDTRQPRMFVNVPDFRIIAVVDLSRNIVTTTIPVHRAGANFPMALDASHHRLFIGCRNPPGLLVYDTGPDTLIASSDLGGDCDDLFFNGGREELYASCGEGRLEIISASDPRRYTLRANIRTSPGARTALYVQQLHRVFLAVPRHGGEDAAIWIYEVKP